MPLLFHWRGKNYRADIQNGTVYTYNLNQNSKAMLRAEPGDTIWAFTRRQDDIYVLAVKGLIKELSRDFGSPYGAHRVWLDQKQTVYFDIEEGLDVEQTIRSLEITTNGRVLGWSFRGHAGVREISKADNQKLEKFAERLRPTAV